jgi:DNA-binding NarL/FixJ family response regulator
MRSSPVRVAVVSSSTIVREGLVSLVGRLGDRAIVVDTQLPHGGCGQADVVVYDLGAAPGPTGLPELRRLAGLGLPMVALVYDGVASQGGRSVEETGTQLVSLAVSADELWEVLERAVPKRARLRADRHDAGDPGLPGGLTHRELTVIGLIGSGLSNEEIAAQMYVSGNTVKTYVRTAYRKLGIRSRIHAALWALEHGLVARPVHASAPGAVDSSPSRPELS